VSQAAIAIENIQLLNSLQHSNETLSRAYDATIEGWARTLQLRDPATEEHNWRIVEMTLRLCKMLDIPESEQVHIRRGAILHDIGKIVLPDSILLKQGPLSESEWELMRQHPTYAYHLLAAIPFLRPALHIPYCHHERWNGSGYPRGLHDEEIPLAARLFAVVDVWDALSSQRPYRDAWPQEKVQHYLQANAGILFDPRIVTAFLPLLYDDL
jgi:HD-GYP domain-containing protein (c-di-GMP phosphodiesterase class II)